MSPGHWSPVQDPQAGVQSLVLGFQDSDDKLVLFQALGSWYTYHNDYAGKPVCWFIRWNGFQSPEPQTVHPRTFWGAPRQLLVSTLKIPREDNDPSRVSATRGRARAALGEVKTGCKQDPAEGTAARLVGGTLLPGWFGLRAQGRGA